jgi:hypothetical protein
VVIRQVCYRAARAGMLTGMLLAPRDRRTQDYITGRFG